MLKKEQLRLILATLFTGVYLFVALFSQNFHKHGSAEVFKDYHFKKTEKTFSSSHISKAASECLSCHLLHDGNYVIPEVLQLSVFHKTEFQKQLFAYEQQFGTLQIFYSDLRGPPTEFI